MQLHQRPRHTLPLRLRLRQPRQVLCSGWRRVVSEAYLCRYTEDFGFTACKNGSSPPQDWEATTGLPVQSCRGGSTYAGRCMKLSTRVEFSGTASATPAACWQL